MTISAVIPTFRRHDLLFDRSLRSVLRQTVQVDEVLIVVDGEEPDDFDALAERLAALQFEAQPAIRTWNIERPDYPVDRGDFWSVQGWAARNFGLDHAKGDWIAPLDDDDEWTDDHIELLLGAATDDVDFIYGKAVTNHGQWYGHWPPGGMNFCVTGDSMISAVGIDRAYRRQYVGEIVRIKTALGKELACTPNHPIAVGDKWVAAQEISIGDYVLGGLRADFAIGPDVENRPARADEVFQSLSVMGDGERMPGRRMDFHGDGIAEVEVQVVSANRSLPRERNRKVVQEGRHPVLVSTNSGTAAERSLRHAVQPVVAVVGPSQGVVHGINASLPSSGVRSANDDLHALARSSSRDTQVIQLSQDRVLGDPDPLRNRGGGVPRGVVAQDFGVGDGKLAGDALPVDVGVRPERVESVVREWFSGHVYNFSTSNGQFLANGIVTHNCDGAQIYRRSLGYRYDPESISRWLPTDADLWVRMIEGGVRFKFVDKLVHRYWPNPR